jgi:hypothetical protein
MFFQCLCFAQNIESLEQPPIFEDCQKVDFKLLKNCFKQELLKQIGANFVVSESVQQNDYKGDVKVLFEVDKEGIFKFIYADAAYEELKTEAKRVFENLPTVQPGRYNGKPTFYQYSIVINIPIENGLSSQID